MNQSSESRLRGSLSFHAKLIWLWRRAALPPREPSNRSNETRTAAPIHQQPVRVAWKKLKRRSRQSNKIGGSSAGPSVTHIETRPLVSVSVACIYNLLSVLRSARRAEKLRAQTNSVNSGCAADQQRVVVAATANPPHHRGAGVRGDRSAAGDDPRRDGRRDQARGRSRRQGALYEDGPSGRYLLGGQWLFRLDKTEVGVNAGLPAPTVRPTAGSRVSVPNAWNANDNTNERLQRHRRLVPQGLPAAVGAPSALAWVVRFESVNYRARVWLNGKPLGTHTGAYLPFEFRLPASLLKRGGVNHLVVRVDNRRRPTDFPPSGLTTTRHADRRLVELRRPAARGLPAQGRPDRLQHRPGAARPALRDLRRDVKLRVTRPQLRRPARSASRVAGTFGGQHARCSARAAVGAKRFATFTKTVRVAQPAAVGAGSPNLYACSCARVGAGATATSAALVRLQTGIRSIKVVDGRLLPQRPPAELPRRRPARGQPGSRAPRSTTPTATQLIAQVQRARRDADPLALPAAPRSSRSSPTSYGILLWSEIPVYAIKTKYLKQKLVRQLAANELRDNILTNGNHPSIDRLVDRQRAQLAARARAELLHRTAPSSTAQALDPTRPVGLAVAGYPGVGCQPAVRAARRHRHQRLLRLVPRARTARSPTATLLSDYLDSRPRLLPEQGDRGHRDGRRGQPRRPGRGEGHLRVPAGLRQLPLRRLRHASRGCRARSGGRCRSSACGRLGRRQPAADAAAAPEGRARLRRPKKPAWPTLARHLQGDDQIGAAAVRRAERG